MDPREFKSIVNDAFESAYTPLSADEQYALDHILEFLAEINGMDGASARFVKPAQPIHFTRDLKHANGTITNSASTEVIITFEGESTKTMLSMTETRSAKDPTDKKVLASIGYGANRTSFDTDEPNYIDSMFSILAMEMGEQKAQIQKEKDAAEYLENLGSNLDNDIEI